MQKLLFGCGILLVLAGCADVGTSQYSLGPQLQPIPATVAASGNPVFVPVTDPQAVSDMAAEVVDDYFKIEREEPVRVIGNMLTEGSISTFPSISPTILEPWRVDTATIDQRIENSLQTYRRRAIVKIIPAENGHWIEVQVPLELVDMPQPDHASSGAATFRYDSGFSRVENPVGGEAPPQGWIPKGRDSLLEQRILGQMQFRAQEIQGMQR